MPKTVVLENVTTIVRYVVHYQMPVCYDDDQGPGHDEYSIAESKEVEAKTDKEAQLAALGDYFHRREICYHGRHAYPTKIEKITVMTTSDGWSSTKTDVIPLPRSERCACRKVYWPIKGEKACHELVPTSSTAS